MAGVATPLRHLHFRRGVRGRTVARGADGRLRSRVRRRVGRRIRRGVWRKVGRCRGRRIRRGHDRRLFLRGGRGRIDDVARRLILVVELRIGRAELLHQPINLIGQQLVHLRKKPFQRLGGRGTRADGVETTEFIGHCRNSTRLDLLSRKFQPTVP